MIVTIRTDITWDGKVADMLGKTSEKKIKNTLKDMTGAVDVEIIEVNSWNDDDDEDGDY